MIFLILLWNIIRCLNLQDKHLRDLLLCYNNSFNNILSVCDKNYADIFGLYDMLRKEKLSVGELDDKLVNLTMNFADRNKFRVFRKTYVKRRRISESLS